MIQKRIEIKSPGELAKMRAAGALLRRVFDEVERHAAPGVSTVDLDQRARKLMEDAGAIPAFLGYHGYPATLCVSVNEEVVHGIPGPRRLKSGDIVSIDCGLVLGGFYSDMAMTVGVGEVSEEARRLMDVTRESLQVGIKQMRAGNRLGSVSAAVQQYVESHGFSVVREYTGHGIGRAMHEPPQVPNFGQADTGLRLKPGIVLAVEPMVNAGSWRTRTLADGWTVVTADGRISAHFEHTIAVGEDGQPWVLTA
jgi:methionyl aminopeptidase